MLDSSPLYRHALGHTCVCAPFRRLDSQVPSDACVASDYGDYGDAQHQRAECLGSSSRCSPTGTGRDGGGGVRREAVVAGTSRTLLFVGLIDDRFSKFLSARRGSSIASREPVVRLENIRLFYVSSWSSVYAHWSVKG